jgi:hypothetical protein
MPLNMDWDLTDAKASRNLSAFAQHLYNTYAASAGNKNFQGNPMPTWDELPEAIRSHWRAVAAESAHVVTEQVERAVNTRPATELLRYPVMPEVATVEFRRNTRKR